MKSIDQQLQVVFGFDQFQEGQREIIEDVMAGENVLGVLPTGSGKSLCYQLPALLLDGLTIVVSPLISLMIDQVRQIKAYYYKEVAAIHSFLTWQEKHYILNHLSHYKLLFMSPELLQQKEVLNHLKAADVKLICIDEAHCISQWGYDFRTDYLRLKETIAILNHPQVLALTGSASSQVQKDIISQLACSDMSVHAYSMERKNIGLFIEHVVEDENEKQKQLMDIIGRVDWPLIIYFSSRRTTEQIAEKINTDIKNAKVAFYHAGLSAENRLKIQEQYMNNQIEIICSTSAFGMGINKKNIRSVIHYHPPTQLESFMQEIGRAGRDGQKSLSVLLYKENDLRIPQAMIENELPERAEIEKVIDYLKNKFLTEDRKLESTEKIIQAVQLNDIKWRFLKFHFERYQLIEQNVLTSRILKSEEIVPQITQICIERVRYKKEKLKAVEKYIHTKQCLRKQLYGAFENDIDSRGTSCCKHCGLEINSNVKHNALVQSRYFDWQKELKALLLIEA